MSKTGWKHFRCNPTRVFSKCQLSKMCNHIMPPRAFWYVALIHLSKRGSNSLSRKKELNGGLTQSHLSDYLNKAKSAGVVTWKDWDAMAHFRSCEHFFSSFLYLTIAMIHVDTGNQSSHSNHSFPLTQMTIKWKV